MLYKREIEVPRAPDEAFAYIADFEHTSEWDPGVAEARRLTDAPTGVGSRFELIAVFRGNRQRFEYVVTEFEEGRRIALRGDGEKARSDDTISVGGANGRTRIAYEADIRLKGLYRLAQPFMAPMFRRMGDRALDGLAQKLS